MRLPQVHPVPLTRRALLQWMGIGGAWLMLPEACTTKKPGGSTTPPAPYQYKFLTAQEVDDLNAIAEAILPADAAGPGGASLGVPEYVDRFLSAFEGGGPLYGGGPYSGRAPLPKADGTPSTQFPPDAYATALPLDRVSAAQFKLLLYGSGGVPGGAPNDAISGPITGLRDLVRNGLKAASALSSQPLSGLPVVSVETIVAQLDPNTLDLMTTLVMEAAFAAPEYGGNKKLAGWQIAHWEGDRQPLGFSWFNTMTGTYAEDPQHPVSQPNPGTDPDPLDPTTTGLLDTLVQSKGFGQFQLAQKFS